MANVQYLVTSSGTIERDGKLSDITDEIVYFVALNLIDLNDDDVSVPEWAESAFNRIVKDY